MEFTLGEINIFTTDLERSMAFYCGVLGFKKLEQERGAVHLKGAGHDFLLLPFAEVGSEAAPYGKRPSVSFDLYVKDIRAAEKFFRSAAVTFEKDLPPGGDHFFVRDPDGNVIEIIED